MLPKGLAPSWVMPRAKFDLDFENGRYWGGEVYLGDATSTRARPSLVTPDNGGFVQYVEYPDGILRTFPSTANRIVPGRGLLVEDQATNYGLWNRDFTNAAWVKSNMTAAKDQAGADLTASVASSLTATSANATVLQSITLTSRGILGSAYVKRLTGSGSVYMTIDNGSTWTDITSQLSATYRRIAVPIQTLANPVIGFKIATSGDAIAADMFQTENALRVNVPSSPILTTTVAFTRPNEHPSFYGSGGTTNAGLRLIQDVYFTGGPFSVCTKYCGNPVGGGGLTIGTDGANPTSVDGGGANGSAASHALSSTVNVGNIGIDNWNKVCVRTTGFGSQVCLNGGSLSTIATTSASTPPTRALVGGGAWTHGSFGNNGSGTTGQPMNGYIARVALFDVELSDGQMIEFTR